ncbi:response regulator transcription factor [Oceanivirga salmonicida]|uniref:response regulator transcription factor n=1 Tax=Oceanivirga salmonicida TaxID=1769291 RepID=UPI000835377F|nr:response regulator [Oceanivirga salmonicida]
MNILIIDDEDIIRTSMSRTLTNSDLEIKDIFEASNSDEADDILSNNSVDIILMDINMPLKNGLELSKEIKEKNPNIMIGIISGYDYFDYMREAIKIGVDDYILKPTTRNDIIEMTKRLIKKKTKKIKENYVADSDIEIEKDNIDEVLGKYIFKSEFNLSYLAEKLSFSKGYLSILFKKKYGLSFQDYVLKVRMEKAVLLLLSTNLKNYEISEMIGFDSVYYFNDRFKKYYGKSPQEYKKEIVRGNNEN